MMRLAAAAGLVLLCGAEMAWAAEPAFPVRIGESETEVRQRLGEPLSWYDDWYGLQNMSYKGLGLIVGVDPDTGLVESVYAIGAYSAKADWSMYQGETVPGLGMSATLEQYTRALGTGRLLARGDWRLEEDNSPDKVYYAWPVGDCELVVEARASDYTENGVVHPRGSVLSARVTRPVSG